MAVAIVDYGAGNLRSAARALVAAGATGVEITADSATVARADRIILPGVGAFGACITALRTLPGMVEALDDAVNRRAVPFLGICVGMQLMVEEGHEFGVHQGLGWIGGSVRRMAPEGLKIPQIGWNRVDPAASRHPALREAGHAYFVHSYACHPTDPAHSLATTDYGGPFTAAIGRDTMLGVQFHPEKSQGFGLALLRRWLHWKP
jgi:glutamine amidotransferase